MTEPTTEQKLRALYAIVGEKTCDGKCEDDLRNPPCPACIAESAISEVDQVLSGAEYLIREALHR
jgi:hypothetical protein